MSAEEKIVEKILSAGSIGIKKTDLRKAFAGEEIDTILERLITDGLVFVDKKSAAYYCWHKDHYLRSLLNSDPKFRLIYESIKSLEQSFNKTSDRLDTTSEIFTNNISNLAKLTKEKNEYRPTGGLSNSRTSMQFDQFKNEFDSAIANYSSSIGWVELAKIRNELCNKNNLSNEEFYRLVEQLTNQYHDKYELSTGGYEGLTVRGLLHGFVRCI
jgi:hypothetical protein